MVILANSSVVYIDLWWAAQNLENKATVKTENE
jgi:hypothetical protein